MAQTIQIRRGTGSAVPSSLAAGELAINLDSGKLFYGNGSAVSSDFRVDSITAENYTVSSSVTSYTFQAFSGSSDFGDDVGDIHKRTGSLNVSGALNVDGNIASTNLTSGRLVRVTANGVLTDSSMFTSTNNDMTFGRDLTLGRNLIIDAGTISNVSTTHVTASGNIKAAAGTNLPTIINSNGIDFNPEANGGGTQFKVDDANAKTTLTGLVEFELGANRIELGQSANQHVTASGDVKVNGTIFTNEIQSLTNNLIISSSTVRLTATTNGEANLILEADSDNDDENDNPFMDLLQDGGGIAGQIGISGDADKWPDGSALSGTSINSMVIGMKGTTSGDNRELIFATADTVALKLDNTQDARFYGNVTNNTNGLYITGDVSASDDMFVGDDLTVGDDITMTSANAAIFMGDSGNEYTFAVGQGGLIINAGVTNPAVINHFIVSASGGTKNADARVGIGISPHPSDMLNISGSIRAGGNIGIAGDITCNDIAINGGNITTAVEVDGLLTAGANLRVGGAGSTSNNFISIDAQNGNDSSGGGITFYETGTYDVDSPQYGAKIVYNEDDDEFAIGTMDNNTFMRQIYMKRQYDRVYLANQVRLEGTTPILVMDNTNTTVADGDTLGQIVWNNNDDDGSTLNLKGIATEDHASGANGGSKLEIQVTPNGTSALSTAATIDQDHSLNVSGSISSDSTILAGWHGSTTRIKILVSDFIPDDIGRPAMIDDTGSDRWLESHSTGVLFASIPIPTGFKATHVRIYGSGTSAMEVSEMNITGKTVTSKGTGNIGTELNITNVDSTDTNYLLIELAQASSEEVYGGYVTIEKS